MHTLMDIVTHIDRKKFRPIVLCAPDGELTALLAKENIDVRTAGKGKYWEYSLKHPFGAVRDVLTVAVEIVRLAQSEKVRIVHTFDGMVFTAACLAKLYLPDLKVIWLDSGFNLYRLHFRMVMWWCFRRAARVATLSNARLQQLLAEGLDPSKAQVVPCGTDFHFRNQYLPFSQQQTNGTIQVGIVGRIVPIKNFEMFLHAARIVADAHPNVRFMIVGSQGLFEDEIDYYHRVLRLTESLKLNDRVTFQSPVADLAQLMKSFDMLVCSSHMETFGRTLVEAMSLSKPVVATAVGALPEVIPDGEVGFLVPDGDATALAEGISRLVADANLRKTMGQNAHQRVLDRYDIRVVVKQWESLYNELLVDQLDESGEPARQ